MLTNTRKRMQGVSLTETLIMMPVFLMLTLGALQYALIYEAKSSLDYATFMSARAGAVDHARKNTITQGLAKSIAPLYSPDLNDTASLVATIAKARIDLAAFSQIKILNPTKEAFIDFGIQNTQQNVKEIPNEMLHLASTQLGKNSKLNIQDANLLKVQVLYGYKLKVPFVNKVITSVSSWFTRDPVKLAYLSQNRLPILATATVRMQSRAWDNSWVTKTADVNKAVTDTATPTPPLILAAVTRPWASGPTGQRDPSQLFSGNPGGTLPIGGNYGSGTPSTGGNGTGTSTGTGNGNPSPCGGSQTTSQTTSTQSTSAGNPIHIVTGNKYQHEIDIKQLPGELGLQFSRHYNSQTDYNGPIGYGWSHTYEIRLITIDADSIMIRQADGRVLYFNHQKDNTYIAQQANDGKLVKLDNGYDWEWNNGRTFQFTDKGQLTRISEKSGKAIQLVYIGDNLHKIVDSLNRSLTLSYNKAGRIATIKDPAGQQYIYHYGKHNNLITVQNPNKDQRRYHYEDANDINNLTGITDERDVRFATWTYDNQDRAILSKHADDVQKVTLEYRQDKTLVTNSKGVTSTYYTKVINQVPLVNRVDGPGCSTCGAGDIEYEYNDNIQLVEKRLKNGTRSVTGYDESGQVRLLQQYKNGTLYDSVNYVYDSNSNRPHQVIKKSINPDGNHVASYKYNQLGNLEQITEKGYKPTGDGKFESIARKIKFSYKNNNLVRIDGPREDVSDIVKFKYNANNQLVETVQPDGQSSKILSYDRSGRPTKLKLNSGSISEVTYDVTGNVASIINGKKKVAFEYSQTGQLVKIVRENGQVYTADYDNAGRQTAIRDAEGNSIGFVFNIEEQLVAKYTNDKSGKTINAMMRIMDAQGKVWGTVTPDGLQKMQGYDQQGRTLITVNGKAKGDYYLRNKKGELLGTVAADKGITRYIADTKGRLSAIKDPLGRITVHLYDDFGNLLFKRSPDTGVTQYNYDRAGNLIERIDADKQKMTYQYNAAGKIIRKTHRDQETLYQYKNGQLATVSSGKNAEAYEYNKDGQIIAHYRRIDSHTFVTRYSYSESTGDLKEKILPSGEVIEYQYGANQGRLSYIGRKKWFTHEPILSDIQYQPFGQRTGYTHQNGIRTGFEYDQTGRITKLVSKDVGKLDYEYDALGNIVGIYRNKHREQYQYDSVGRLTTAETLTGEHRYEYNLIGNRVKNKSKHNNVQFNKLGLTTRDGARTYEYNAEHRPVKLFVDGKLKAEYLYNTKGERIRKTVYKNGSKATQYFLYDMQRRLSAIASENGEVIREYQYLGRTPVAIMEKDEVYSIHTDHLGTPYKVTNENREILWSAQYNPFGQIRIEKANIQFNIRFSGQYHDLESGTYYNYFRDYNPKTGKYIQPDPLGISQGKDLYHYVNNGPLNATDPMGLFKVDFGPIGSPIHEGIVREAFLRFNSNVNGAFSNDTVELFVVANRQTDTDQTAVLHFDNPNDRPPIVDASGGLVNATVTEHPSWIDASLAVVNQKRALYGKVNGTIIACKIDKSGAIYDDIDITENIKSFGQNTHSLADFYAHSNWVDPESRGGYYLQEIYDISVPTYNRRIMEEGYVPKGLNRKTIWDEKTFVGMYTGTAEAGTLGSDYWHNVFSGEDSFGNPDKTTHSYWEKDEPNSVMTTDQTGNAISTHDLARELAIQHTVTEIQRLWDASSANSQLRESYGMTNQEKAQNNIKYWQSLF